MKEYICTIAGSQGNNFAGYGAIIESSSDSERKQLTNVDKATSNHMELQALIACLNSTPINLDLTVYSSSRWITDAFNKGGIHSGKQRNFKSVTENNRRLWIEITKLIEGRKIYWEEATAKDIADAKTLARRIARWGDKSKLMES